MAAHESVGQLVIDGVLAFELMSLNLNQDPQKNRVMTSNGYSGTARGAGFTEVVVSRAIPVAGFNIDIETYIDSTSPTPVQVFTGGKVYTFDADFERANTTSGVNRAAEQSFTLVGPFTTGIPV